MGALPVGYGGEMADPRDGFRRDQRRRGLSQRTIRERDIILNSLERSIDVPLVAAETEQIEAWLDSCKIGPRSRSVYLSTARCFYEWIALHGYRADDPTRLIARPRLPRLLPRPIDDDDLDHAIREAPPKMKAWLCLAAYAGLRCKEIAGLRREDILERRTPAMLRVTDGKGGHQALLPLNDEVMAALRQHGLPSRGYVFSHDGKPYRPSSVSAIGSRYLHSLGIEATMHQLRHWFGTAVWAASKDMRVTQEMMRHASPITTAGYAAYDQELAVATVTSLRVRRRAVT